MGREMADAEGIRVETLIIDDDVSVKDSTYTVGRRGVAGNFFVIKAVGAAAEEGAELDELVALGTRVNGVTRTMGMALTACTPPAKGSPLFELGDDEMEMGVGIHGEPGRRREKLASANEIIDELLEAVVTDLPYQEGDEVAPMINGLGGTRSASSTSSTAAPTPSSPTGASPCARTTSGSTAPPSTWPAPPSPWSSSMTSWSGCWRLRQRSPSASSSSGWFSGPIGEKTRLVLLDAEHDLGGLDEHGDRPALGQAEALSRGTGDRRDDLLAIDVDDHLGHHRAELDAPDGAGELVAGAELHGSSLVGSVGGTVWESTGGSRPTPRRPARPGRTSGLAAASGWWYQPPRMWSSHPLPGV